jgi:hypothetical protein
MYYCNMHQKVSLPGVYVILSCGLRDVFSVALLSGGGGIANTDEDAGCDVTAGPPDSSSLGSSCNRTNPNPHCYQQLNIFPICNTETFTNVYELLS